MTWSDDFRDLSNWIVEAEQPASISAHDGALDIDAPAGVTLWFSQELGTDIEIEFDATAVSAGGPNDHVSDLNVFWMAHNADGVRPVYAKPRRGKFADYDDLLTYYVGLGGNRNTTTRFRRYVGEAGNRPLLPEHDLSARQFLLVPNRRQRITLIADGPHIEYRRDGRAIFRFEDPAPYTSGWFALRTTSSHLRIERLRIRAPVLHRSRRSRARRHVVIEDGCAGFDADSGEPSPAGPRYVKNTQEKYGFRVESPGVGVYNARPWPRHT